ncbi:hypothetical protein TNCV_1353311 [Trichonephila clavipes]|nr:hypothetical protein TNCV_1353311 [Trichonephila clavipes]
MKYYWVRCVVWVESVLVSGSVVTVYRMVCQHEVGLWSRREKKERNLNGKKKGPKMKRSPELESRTRVPRSFKANHRYIDPVEVFLGSRYEQKLSKDGIPQQIPRKDTCQYISIAETMQHIISIDGFINLFQAYKLDKKAPETLLCVVSKMDFITTQIQLLQL